jgi:hypothetical protein
MKAQVSILTVCHFALEGAFTKGQEEAGKNREKIGQGG